MKIPIIKFSTDEQFTTELSNNAHDIHLRTLYGIDHAFNTNADYVTIAIVQTQDMESEIGAPDDVWIDNLEKTLDYFEEIEDYTRCQEVVQLLKKLQK